MNNSINHKFHHISRVEYQELLAVPRGDIVADYIIDNVSTLDLVNGGEISDPIVIKGRYIASVGAEYAGAPALQRTDARGATAMPGFIDVHLHIEFSMMTSVTFGTVTLPCGLTTAICDPHETVSVMGEAEFAWFARCAEQARQNWYLQVSSCVPTLEGCDVNNVSFTLGQMLAWRDHPRVTGLVEIMDYPGVISGWNTLLDKLDAFRHLTLDGHCPGLDDKELNAYIAAGIGNYHESYRLGEGCRKLQLGMSSITREGPAARNLNALASLVNEFNSPQCMLCTDDRNPQEIAYEGHIDALIYCLIGQHNVSLHVAYRVVSWSMARHFGLNHLGLLAPGKQADIVLLSDARKVTMRQMLMKGEPTGAWALQAEESARLAQSIPSCDNIATHQPVPANDFTLQFTPEERYRVIDVVHNELTTHSHSNAYSENGSGRDGTSFITVSKHYGRRLVPAYGLFGDSGLNEGALAAMVGHDSHNIVMIGRSAEEMALAVNQVIQDSGELCVVCNDQAQNHLPLPIAGLMSIDTAQSLAGQTDTLKAAARECGPSPNGSFIQVASLSLPVIPTLRLASQGLLDSGKFTFTTLEVTE